MGNQLITRSDLDLMASAPDGKLNIILAGMSSLMVDTNEKVRILENQDWFQRMSYTISGKNKMTQMEIVNNQDKINLYVTEAMNELYNMNCIDHELIVGLGNRINELYDSQVEINQMIGIFAQKLNEKIESIDNYHMLITEINQGVYDNQNKFISITKIISQLDLRTVKDDRKMEILLRALEERGIADIQEIEFSDVLESLLNLTNKEAGILALFFGNIREEYIAEIMEQTVYSYYFLPEKTQKMKSKKSIVGNILKDNNIDLSYSISSYEMCKTIIESYTTYVVELAIEKQNKELESKMETVRNFLADSIKLLELLECMIASWSANSGEFNTYNSKIKYAEFLSSLIENLEPSSYIRNSLLASLNNLTFFTQKVFLKHGEFYNLKVIEEYGLKVNKNIAISIDNGKYKTIAEFYEQFIKNTFFEDGGNNIKECYEEWSILNIDYEDIEDSFDILNYSFDMQFLSITIYKRFFLEFLSKIAERIEECEDYELLDESYELSQKFPVVFEEEYSNIFIRNIEDEPHIEIMYNDYTYIGVAELLGLEDFAHTTLLLKFVNIDIKGYSVHLDVIKNEYLDWDTFETYEYVDDVEFGEWVESDTLELKIWKLNDYNFTKGKVLIKISINEDSDIVGYVKA
jgi:hypothetical protein